MDPNQPQPQPQPQRQSDYSVDYLNEISTPLDNRGGPSKMVLLIAGAIGLVVVIGFIASLLLAGSTDKDKAGVLLLRLDGVQKVADDYQSNLRDGELQNTNSEFSIFLTNTITDIEEPLDSIGVSKKSISKDDKAAQKAFIADLEAQFDDAELNVLLDRTYAREMAYQVSVLQSSMQSLAKSTDSKKFRELLKKNSDNLEPVEKKFREFADTK